MRTQVDGVASDWDADRCLVTLDAVGVAKGPRALRRLVRRGVTMTLRITAATRPAAVDAGGDGSRVPPPAPFGELDLAADDVDVEAAGRLPRVVLGRPARS